MTVRRTIALLTATLMLAIEAGPAVAASTAPRVSFTQVQQQFMCTVCGESLTVARSPQAYSENQYLRDLIRAGTTESQIKRDMVAQYGPAVLAKPPAHGFSLLVYVIPAALLVLGIAVLALTIPRWRNRSRTSAAAPISTGPVLSDDDARRLDADIVARQG